MPVKTRAVIDALPAYKPGKAAEQADTDLDAPAAIKLSSNETPYPPIPAVRDAMVAAVSASNRYPDNGAAEVREAISKWVGVLPTEVAVGCGSSGVLQQIFLSFVETGEEVVFPWRSFEVYPIYTQLVGGIAVTPPLVDNAFDLDAVARAITERTKLVLLATPNNPTGTALLPADIRNFLERVPNDVLVVVDEAYKEFMGADYSYSEADLIADFDNVVILRTFSKAYGLAGARIGYAIANEGLIENINKTLLPFSVNVAAQAGAVAALNAMNEVQTRVDAIVAERERIRSTLLEQGWPVPQAEGNFVYLPVGERTVAVYEGLERLGVVARPFAGEGVRVTIGSPEQNDRVIQGLNTLR